MKLEIRLIDEKERALQGAELAITLVFKNGDERALPSVKSDARGEVPIDPFDKNTFRQINFAESEYQIRVGNQSTPRLRLGRPTRVSANHARYVLKAIGLGSGNRDDAVVRQSTIVKAILETEDGGQIGPSTAFLNFSAVTGEKYKLGPNEANKEGIVVFELSIPADAIDWSSLRFRAEYNDTRYQSIKTGVPDETGEGWVVVVTLREQKVEPDPDQPGEGELEWSTGPEDSGWVVQGLVTGKGGMPVSGVRVEAYSKSVGKMDTLGAARTGENGRYRIFYEPEKFIDDNNQVPSLILKAFRGERELVTSGLIASAGPNERVDFSIFRGKSKGVPFYIQLLNDTEPFLEGRSPSVLEIEDVALLADKTNHNSIVLAHFVRAWDLTEAIESGFVADELAESFFGLTAGGLTPTLDGVLGTSNEKIRTILKEAIESSWISAVNIDEVIAKIEALRTDYYKDADSDLSKLLDAVGVTKSNKSKVIALALGDGSGDEKWAGIESVIGVTNTNKLRGLVEVWRTLEKDATITVYLYEQFQIGSVEALVLVDGDQLKTAIEAGNEMPVEIPGSDDKERQRNYALALLDLIEQRNPHLHFLKNLSVSSVKEAETRAKKMLARDDINLEDPATLRGLPDEDDTELADLATLYLVCPKENRARSAEQLMAKNIMSSMEVIARSREKFRAEMKPDMKESVSNPIYDRAAHLGSVTTALSILSTESDPNQKDTLLGQLFSDAINHTCTHCRSVYSPSAYLLDLYRYLGRATFGNETGIDLLNERRPDIEGIELSCENSDTVMPYIDLTLEVLESMVASQPLVSRQTTWQSEQLRAEPEYVNPVAYEILMNQTFPWSLGFSRDLERSKTYLNHIGIDLATLSESLSVNGSRAETINQAFALTFGVANPQGIVLAGQPKWLANWGVSNRNALENRPGVNGQKRNLADLSAWLHIDGELLVDLLGSVFVSGGQSLVEADGSIKWNDLDQERIIRLQFIGRLAVQTGYSVDVLDRIFSLEEVDETSPLAWREELTAIQFLGQHFGSSIDDVVALWEADSSYRDAALASEFGLSDSTFAGMLTISGSATDRPSSVARFAKLLAGGEEHEIDLEDLLNAIGVPDASHRFSEQINSTLFGDIRTSITDKLSSGAEGETAAVGPSNDETFEAEARQIIVDMAAEFWSMSPGSVSLALEAKEDLVKAFLAEQIEDEPSVIRNLAQLSKQSWIIDVLSFSEKDIEYVVSLARAMKWPNLQALPVEEGEEAGDVFGFMDLAEHQRVNRLYFGETKNLFESLQDAGTDTEDLITALTADDPWSEENLQFVLGGNGLNFAGKTAFFNKRGFSACSRILDALMSTEATIDVFRNAVVEHNGEDAQSLLQMGVPETEYYEVLQQLNDPLREQCQSRLTETILTQSRDKGARTGFESSHALYEHILIDPEMSSCFETSRIKQASASIQQLIQRIMLNLEEPGGFNSGDLAQWSWRKNYRVWEANRKVFITPENWVEPELRDNKTELYRELETELLQGEVDDERAEQTLLSFARRLLSLSRMEMVATLQDQEAGRNHVFARTSDHPRRYYWCTRENNGLWGGWETIDQEIDGDHILPVIYANRLFLFWLNLTDKVNTDHNDYKDRLAEIEANEEITRGRINELSQGINTLEEKIAEYRTYQAENYAGVANVWKQIADAADKKLEQMVLDHEQAQEDLASFKSQKAYLTSEFSYFECNLTWSQYDRLTGWSPAKRSVDAVNTIYTNEDGDDVHLRSAHRLWILANPNEGALDIELRSDAGNADGLSHDYRLGLFEFDPVLEFIDARDETDAPKIERKVYFPTIPTYGQKLVSIYASPVLKIDVDNQDQTLLTWDPDVGGALACPEKINGYNPSHSPFLFSQSNRSYLLDPLESALGKPLVDVAAIPSVNAPPSAKLDAVTNTNFQALSVRSGTTTIESSVSPTFTQSGLRTAATPLGSSIGKLADGRTSSEVTLNTAPATPADWDGIKAVMEPVGIAQNEVTGNLVGGQKWHVSVLYHPFADIIVSELYRGGLDGLYRPDADSGNVNASRLKRQDYKRGTFETSHSPTDFIVLDEELEERFEFNRVFPYSVYNWEIFFHAPFAIAKQLTRNRRYEDAQRWLHFIFDPVSRDENTNPSCWRFGPFYDEHVRLLDGSQDELTEFAEQDYAQFEAQVSEWEQNPFNPHAIARLRTISYMRATFIAYIDNLVAWADDLFRRDTMESVSEAAQLYIHAAQLLGPAPMSLPDHGLESDRYTLKEYDQRVEEVHPLVVASGVDIPASGAQQNDFFSRFGDFCIPTNSRIQDYWDRIADRLFKIRHCMNIEGVERTLVLYQPPIDPAMLVKAAAAGVDIGAAIAAVGTSRPHYRFSVVLQKAKEFASEVRSLGGALLSVLEKQEAEELTQLRSNHELVMQERILEIKKERLSEAKEAHKSLEKSLFATLDRMNYYQGLIDKGSLDQEKEEIKKLENANELSSAADVLTGTASVLSAIPQTGFNGPFPKLEIGGLNLGDAGKAIADVSGIRAGGRNRKAGMLGRDASMVRRRMDWGFQLQQAKRDIERLEKDQIASEIRIAMADKEIADQETQIANAEEAYSFLRDKFTNTQLYGWMVSQLSALHYQAYQLALDMARQAEACMNFELDGEPASIIEFGYWDGLKKGLLSGERLIHDLNRLDAHYLSKNFRKLELSKQVSLLRVDPGALLDLKTTGNCTFTIPEYLFDLDYPGHYKRQIKSVSLTIPALSGPYMTISCSLSLTASRMRVEIDEDPVPVQLPADSVATSSAQSDSGLFQFDFRDERYLPFEGHGVDSDWEIQLPPASIAQFDYSTISDVILNVFYTAQSDESRHDSVVADLEAVNLGLSNITLYQLLSMKSHFPDLWAQLSTMQAAEEGSSDPVIFTFSPHQFPYLVAHRGLTISSCDLYAQYQDGSIAENGVTTGIGQVTLSGEEVSATVTDQAAVDLLLQTEQPLKDIHLLIGYTTDRAS